MKLECVPDFNFILVPPISEVRFLGRATWAIYTADPRLISKALADPRVQGLNAYITINELMADTPERHGVARDVLIRAGHNQLTCDADVKCRRKLFFDSDSVNPTGAAATDAQRSVAHAHSAALEAALTAEGWSRPIVCDSGNGAHRLYAVDLPNSRETDLLVSNLLRVMARKFDTTEVKLDKSVSNAGRITRLYGSRNQKAGRDSAVLYVPDQIIPVSVEQIKGVLEKWRVTVGYKKPLIARVGGWTQQRMESFLDFHDIPYSGTVEKSGGLLWILDACPFNEDHTGTSVAVLVTKAGFPKFKCLHNGCADITNSPWRRFVALLNTRNRKVFSWKAQKKSESNS
jgi:hypothetical protein